MAEPLTEREKDVLNLLGLASRIQAALYAVGHKLVEPPAR